MKIKMSLVGLIVYLAFVYNIERLDFGQQNVIDIHSIVYVIILAAVLSQLLFRPVAKIRISLQVAFWIGVHLLSRLVLAVVFGQVVVGGIETYIYVTEVVLLTLGVVLGRRVAQDFIDFEDSVEQLSLGETVRKARKLDEVAEDIQLELSRSRRHHYPLSVVVVQSDPKSVAEVIHRTVQDVQLAMMKRYVLAGLGRALGRQLRRTDILVDQVDKGRFVIVSPDTDGAQARQLIDRVQTLVAGRIGIQIMCGISTFPEAALTFEELVHTAETELQPPTPAAALSEFDEPLNEVISR